MNAVPICAGATPASTHGSEAARDGLTTVVVVTADSGLGVSDCIARVLDGLAEVEVVIVDNDSSDGSIESLLERFGTEARVRVVRNSKNLGFGPACNHAARVARGDALLFLNPDCLVERDTIARLRSIVAADGQIGLVGVLQTDAQGRVDPASRRNDPLLRRALITILGLSRWSTQFTWLPAVEISAPAYPADIESVDAVSGALMLLPRTVFEVIGGFDEGYFLHCEDLDLCRRVRDRGSRVVCANAIRVVHAKGGSSRNRRLFVTWHKHRGMWRWFVKFDPAARHFVLRGIVAAGIATSFLFRAIIAASGSILQRARS